MASLYEHLSPFWSSVLSLQNNQNHNHNPSAQKRQSKKSILQLQIPRRANRKRIKQQNRRGECKGKAKQHRNGGSRGSVQDTVLTRGAKQKLLTSPQHPQATSATGQFTQILAPPFANSLSHQRRAEERTQSCFLGEQENVNFKDGDQHSQKGKHVTARMKYPPT